MYHLASPRNHSHAELKVGTDLDQRSFGASKHEGMWKGREYTKMIKNHKETPKSQGTNSCQKKTDITWHHEDPSKSSSEICFLPSMNQGSDHNGKATAATTDAHEACPTTWRCAFLHGTFSRIWKGPNKCSNLTLEIFQKRSCKAYQKLRSLHLRSRA